MINPNEQESVWAYCYTAGVVYYDVAQELVDHMIEWIEDYQLAQKASFDEAFEKMQEVFTVQECQAILHAKALSAKERIRNEWMRTFLGYFSWPRITLTFLLQVSVWLVGRYIGMEIIPATGLLLLNGLVVALTAGRGKIIYRNSEEITEKLITFRKLITMQRWFMLFPMVYGLAGISHLLSIVLPQALTATLFYLFPLALLVTLAWRQTAIKAHEKIRKEYPAAFAE
jgi:hypothetical protein